MKKTYFLLLFFITFSLHSIAQQATIKGTVYNGNSKETIPGVNVILDEKTGVATDFDGKYSLKVEPGTIKVTYKYIGYATVVNTYTLKPGQTRVEDIQLFEESMAIEGVVVSAGKFEQKLSDVTISMSVLKPAQIEKLNTNNISDVINKIPGVDVYDEQPSIRGGSGYSYGAGSRVLVMMDDMPLISADAGDPKWDFMPIENVSQVEVLKGASSALFGSSALNGVINMRTAFPKDKPQTKIIINEGVYLAPQRRELIWWDEYEPGYSNTLISKLVNPLSLLGVKNPGFGGITFTHLRKMGQFDLVVGGQAYEDQGFRYPNAHSRARLNANFRYRSKKFEGLSVGLNTNSMFTDATEFFLWQNADSGAYLQRPDAVNHNRGYRVNVDPYFLYFNKRGSKYSLKLRYFRTANIFPGDTTGKTNIADLVYGDYQYQHNFKGKHNLTAGVSGSYSNTQAELFGKHDGVNLSIYAQYDAKFWKKFSISLGIRGEYYRIDTAESESTISFKINGKNHKLPLTPVFRAGVSYEVAKYTFIRASFGQGYRFPSIAEKFIKTNLGGLNLFPNKLLKPETGWSAELGIKYGFRAGNWNGYLDAAGFWTEYKDMMEFTFGIYKPDTAQYATLDDIGFKSLNVGHARVTGLDFSFTGQGNFFGFPLTILAGYTFIYPIDLNYDPMIDTSKTENNKYLKYRNLHSVKLDVDLTFHFFTLGIGMIYNSNIINIDKAFEGPLIPGYAPSDLLPGLKAYRDEHDKGYFLMNLRGLFDISETQRIGIHVNNLLNTEYMTRPGFIEAPRNIAIQYSLTF
ncbi:MAG: TonB-dependent receptor [Bacteroidales bacterium]|jgi:iron complex outermembrane receptor protein|nr:TonB-dependent receptor [Bacteroidales bacterium]